MADTLLIYYTFEGNTGLVAGEPQKRLDAAAERLQAEREPPRKGLGKFPRGGKSALAGSLNLADPLKNQDAAIREIAAFAETVE